LGSETPYWKIKAVPCATLTVDDEKKHLASFHTSNKSKFWCWASSAKAKKGFGNLFQNDVLSDVLKLDI